MLNYLGEGEAAAKIEQAVERAFQQKTIILKPNGSAEIGAQAVAEAITDKLKN